MNFNIFIRRTILPIAMGLTVAGCSDNVQFSLSTDDPNFAVSGMEVTENFIQGYIGKKLDILFVVDNSGSMSEEQQKMGDRIDSFLSTLYDVDWQLGITTTDVSDGKYGLKGNLLTMVGTNSVALTKNTPNYMTVFKNTIVRKESINCGTDCASGDEQPLRAAIMAVEKRNAENRGFFRDGAELGLLVLSDEDEMSTGPVNATSPQEVANTVKTAWGDQKQLLTYGMVIVPGDTACLSTQGGNGHYGTFVSMLASLTSGLVGSICDTDYAPTLGLLSNHVRRLLEKVDLHNYPVPDSVRIIFTPEYQTTWRVDGRRIFFDDPPPKGTNIKVKYTVL